MTPLIRLWPVAVVVTAAAAGLLASKQAVLPIWGCLVGVVLLTAVQYRYNRTYLPHGAATVALASMVGTYIAGLIPRVSPVYAVNPGAEAQWIITIGSASMLLGYGIGNIFEARFRLARRRQPVFQSPLFKVIFASALIVAGVNYVSGGLPLLAGDVNAARFAGNYGALGNLWPFVLTVCQVAVVYTVYLKWHACASRFDYATAVLSGLVLVLSGSRSIVVIPLAIVGMLWIERRRPRLSTLALCSFVGLALLSWTATWRMTTSATYASNRSYLLARGLDSPVGVLDVGLQSGPRVLERLIQIDASLNWGVALGDILQPLDLAEFRSDRLITAILGADPELVGGTPPTGFGGLWLDGGWAAVLVVSFGLGVLLAFSQQKARASGSFGEQLWYGYLASYIALSSYSYFSLSPSLFVVIALALLSGLVGAPLPRANRKSLT